MTIETVGTVDKLKQLIIQGMGSTLAPEEMDASVSLFEDGLGLDSIAVVELISLVEKTFEMEFSDTDLNLETFSSLQALADFIESRQGND